MYVQRANGVLTVADGNSYEVLASVPSAIAGVVAVNETTNRIYVTDGGGGGCDCTNIVMIDGATNQQVATRVVAKGMNGVTVDPVTNRVYVGSFYDHVLLVLDGDTLDTKFASPIAGSPTFVDFDALSHRVFVGDQFTGNISTLAVPQLAGTTTAVTDAFGIASFVNLIIPVAGSAHQLRAFNGSTSALSLPFDIFGPTTIAFDTPSLGLNDSKIIDPYAAGFVTFTAEVPTDGVGLVKNSYTSACVLPADANQKLGTGVLASGDAGIGLASEPSLSRERPKASRHASAIVEEPSETSVTRSIFLCDGDATPRIVLWGGKRRERTTL